MHRTRTILSSLAVVVSAAGAMGCSSSSTSTSMGPVSFSSDIMPIFQQSCTLSSVCHGQMNNSGEENLYLGENAAGGNTATVIMQTYTGLVGVAALEDPKMSLVTAGDTKNSFLVHKIAGDQGSLAADCAMGMCSAPTCQNAPCGTTMPYLSGMLDQSKITLIENWISQGAHNN